MNRRELGDSEMKLAVHVIRPVSLGVFVEGRGSIISPITLIMLLLFLSWNNGAWDRCVPSPPPLRVVWVGK